MKSPENMKDDPKSFVPCKCALCEKCWRHVRSDRCVYGGPFDGYDDRKANEMTKKPKRPRDINQLARLMVDIATSGSDAGLKSDSNPMAEQER